MSDSLSALDATVHERTVTGAPGSYTQELLGDRNKRLKKVGEEAAEFVVASADNNLESLVNEAADVIYHLTVALHAHDKSFDDVKQVLWQRSQ